MTVLEEKLINSYTVLVMANEMGLDEIPDTVLTSGNTLKFEIELEIARRTVGIVPEPIDYDVENRLTGLETTSKYQKNNIEELSNTIEIQKAIIAEFENVIDTQATTIDELKGYQFIQDSVIEEILFDIIPMLGGLGGE